MLTNDQINREFERLNFRYRLQEILETNDLIDLWSNGWLDKTEDPYIDGVFDQVREYIGKIGKLEDGLRLYLEKNRPRKNSEVRGIVMEHGIIPTYQNITGEDPRVNEFLEQALGHHNALKNVEEQLLLYLEVNT